MNSNQEPSDEPDYGAHAHESADASPIPLAALMAAEAGFPTPWSVNQPVPARVRRLRLEHKARACEELITDIQQWLVDDDLNVRTQARAEVTTLLRRLHVGDENEHRREPSPDSVWVRLSNKLVYRRGVDVPVPKWATLKGQRRIRWVLNWSGLVLALCTTAALATGRPVVALCFFTTTVAIDLAEHVFTKLVRNRSVDLRWFSCVTTQIGDAFILSGIAMALALGARPMVAAGVVAAVLTSMVSSFVRVSALQAGHRIWLSRTVRAGRYTAVLIYCVVTALGLSGARGAIAAAVVVFATAVWELAGVALTILRGEHESSGQVIVMDADERISMYAIDLPATEFDDSLTRMTLEEGEVGV